MTLPRGETARSSPEDAPLEGGDEASAEMVERLHAFIDWKRPRALRRHHEIYLRDPRRTAPERLRTIIRQPMVA